MVTRGFVYRVCGVQDGEGKKALQFVTLAFLCAVATFGGLSVGDGLFVERVGTDAIPLTFFITALILLGLSTLTLRALSRVSVHQLFSLFIKIGMACFVGGALFLLCTDQQESKLFWTFCKIAGEVFSLVMYTALWNFIDQSFHLEEAKRLYGIFCASAMVGGATGSAAVALSIDQIGPSGCLVGIVVVLAVVLQLTRQIREEFPIVEEQQPASLTVRETVFELTRSPFILGILVFNVLMLTVQVAAECEYMATLARHLPDGENGFTSFLGGCRGWVCAGNVLFGVLMYGRMIARLGIRNAILIPSLVFISLFGLWVFGDPFFIGIFGLIAVEGVCVAIEDSNVHMLVNSVPNRLKARLRIVVEQFIEPLGMLLGSSMLMIFQTNKPIGLVFACVSLGVALILRALYPGIIRSQQKRYALHPQKRVA